MNRQQRRASVFKRSQYDRNAQYEPSRALAPILWSRPLDKEESALLSNEARLSWHHLTNGTGSELKFDTLAQHMNAAAVVAADIDELLLDVINRAHHALAIMQARYRRTGKFGPDAQSLQDVPPALDALDEILRHATPRQLTDALMTSRRMLQRGETIVYPTEAT